MKPVTDTLGVARSNVAERMKAGRTRRGPQSRDGDAELAADVRRLVDARPTYGYRRIVALINHERRSGGLQAINRKRVYRLMRSSVCCSPVTPAAGGRVSTPGGSPRSGQTCAGAPMG